MDMEKVKKGIWQCWLPSTEVEYETQCHDCPYYDPGITLDECMTALRTDALALLKEQEDEIDNLKQTAQSMMEGVCLLKEQEAKKVLQIRNVAYRTIGYCPSCGRGLDSYEDGNSGDHITNYCYNCGQAVKWE